MLIDSDIERFDSIMDRVRQRREERDFLPDRNEDRIAEILSQAEKSAAGGYEDWFDSRLQFASPVKFQPSASDSDNGKEFPQIDRYRNFASDDE